MYWLVYLFIIVCVLWMAAVIAFKIYMTFTPTGRMMSYAMHT